MLLHAENWTVPQQLFVRSSKAQNNVTQLLFETSLVDARFSMPKHTDIEEKKGLRIFSLEAALIACSPQFFIQYPTDARAVLNMIKDASQLLPPLLEGGHSTIAGRLTTAFRNLGYDKIADDLTKTMQAAGYKTMTTFSSLY